MSETIRQILSQYISTDVLKQPRRSVDPDMPLISTGLIDSFNLIELALFVEEQFGVKIADTELNAQTFDTLNGLAALIEARQNM